MGITGKTKDDQLEKLIVGWREWVALPELGIPAIKAKMDTGARTAAIHTFNLETFTERGCLKVRFGIHPLRKRKKIEIFCTADVVDRRIVTDSGGHREMRYFIRTFLQLGTAQWHLEISLAQRETMLFRMLVGRNALKGRALVDPSESYLFGKSLAKSYPKPKRK